MKTKKPVLQFDCEGKLIRRYESVRECRMALGLSHGNILYWIRNGMFRRGSYFEFEDESNPQKTVKRKTSEEKSFVGCTIVRYELRNNIECITPCPFKRDPKPKVGSYACGQCVNFEGKDKIKQEVICSRN